MGNSIETHLYNAEITFANASCNLRCRFNVTVFLSIALS